MYASQLKELLDYDPDKYSQNKPIQQEQVPVNSQDISPTLRQEDTIRPEDELPWYKKLGTTLGLYNKPETQSPYANRVEGQ